MRKDLYGGSALNRMKIVFQIIDAIRDEFPVSSGFCVGIKLNSSDYIVGFFFCFAFADPFQTDVALSFTERRIDCALISALV